MKSSSLALVFVVVLCRGAIAEEAAVPLCEPWEAEYAGQDATGKQTIALWPFRQGADTDDASGHGRRLKLEGAVISPKGRFGACLESFAGWPVEDKRHAAVVQNHPTLSPKGPFTIEFWISPKPELNKDYPDSFLIDKKYVAHDDYQLILGPADRNGSRVLRACLGFGVESSNWHSRPMQLAAGEWYHLAFTYDGEGTGSFYLNGLPWGSQLVAGRKAISPGKHPLSIGDRIGSYYHGFPGLIDQVRICDGVREFRRAKFERVSDRAAFVRNEPQATVRFRVTNLQRVPMAEAVARIALSGMTPKEAKLANLGPGQSMEIDYPVATDLRPDAYQLVARLRMDKPTTYESEESFPVQIVARQAQRFPVVMWGIYGGVSEETERLKRIGFTHVLGLGADVGAIWEAGKPIAASKPEAVAKTKKMLDEALANDLSVVASLSPGSSLRGKSEFSRVNRQGKPLDKDICALTPGLDKFCYNVGASVSQTYGQFPAFSGALAHTEVRDAAQPCFHAHDREAFRKYAGFDVPPEAGSRSGVDYAKLANFPADRVIPDNHPLYLYYRWYWKIGDGWNGLNTALVRGLKSTDRKDLWTWHDPAVRVASVYGSGGEVDVVSQWTYSYPDPIRIGVATDELLAMAGGVADHKQQVMKMTQIIWYRSQTAPIPKKPADELSYKARWEQEQPDAPFITIAPMHLREAFWTKIARPIKGIMYHGWQSLVPCSPLNAYRYTHPQTQHELARLVRQVVEPLGPTLLAVPGVKSDVAFLESFASQMFARRGTYGWCGGWGGDAYHVMLYAGLQPDIVFDETITQRGLDSYRVLVMTDCDVITQSIVQRIKQFQAQGGLIVGDERLAPAIKPDILLPSYKRTGRSKDDKAALVALAGQFRKQFDAKYARYVDSSNPEVIPYRRRWAKTDYVFVVNDQREYGEYVGQHGLVMENGLPSDTVVSIHRPAGFVYDLVHSRPVPARQDGGKLAVDLHLGPCDGGLYMVSERPVARVQIKAPDVVARGKQATCTIEVQDAEGRPLDAVVPLVVDIRDAEGRRAEFSGSYAAVDGKLALTLDIAPNDPSGIWQVEARELASGRTTVQTMRVLGPKDWPPAKKTLPKDAANPVQPNG
jgi:hypothetical protein